MPPSYTGFTYSIVKDQLCRAEVFITGCNSRLNFPNQICPLDIGLFLAFSDS